MSYAIKIGNCKTWTIKKTGIRGRKHGMPHMISQFSYSSCDIWTKNIDQDTSVYVSGICYDKGDFISIEFGKPFKKENVETLF